jgi:hypothetical protein
VPPPGWYEVARHIWHKPDCKSITHYENVIVWSKEYKRKVSRVWSIPILDYRSLYEWKPHPTQKPVKLLRYLLDLYTKEGDTVLDPFVGTGTTAVACKQMHRHFIAIDNDPEYVRMATARLTPRASKQEAAEEPTTDDANEAPIGADAPMPEEPPEDASDTPAQDLPNDPLTPPQEGAPLTPPAQEAPPRAHLSSPRSHHRRDPPAQATQATSAPAPPTNAKAKEPRKHRPAA